MLGKNIHTLSDTSTDCRGSINEILIDPVDKFKFGRFDVAAGVIVGETRITWVELVFYIRCSQKK